MSRALRNPEVRWFAFAVLVTLGSLTAAFLLQAASQAPAAAAEVRAATSIPGPFTFTTPLQLPKPPPLPTDIFFIADGEPEIKVDIDGNIYASAINGVPGGTDLWKSTNKGNSFDYMGQPDGLQDKCNAPLSQCLALGGADDSIDVSPGGYLYISSLYIGSVTVSTSYDGGTGGVEPGQKWEVHPAATGIPIEDRQWVAAYGPQTLNMTVRQAPGTGRLLFTKSTDAGKTFSPPILLTSANSTEGNLVVDPYNGNLYTTFIPAGALNRIDLLKSTDGGATWTTKTGIYTGPAGSDPAHKFTILAVDRGGNLHLVFSSTSSSTGTHVYLTSSTDQGATWLPAVQVDSGAGNTTTAVQPWVVAGSAGVVNITWLGSPASSPVKSNWHVFFAQTRNALVANPTFAENQVETAVMHDQDICFNGSGCANNQSQSPGNRDLLEYYTMTLDPEGNANIAYADSVTNCPEATCITHTWYTKQNAGPRSAIV